MADVPSEASATRTPCSRYPVSAPGQRPCWAAAHDKNAGNDATILQIIYAFCLRDVPTLSERLKYWLICWHIMWLITR